MNVTSDMDMFIRLKILEQTCPTVSKDPETCKICVVVSLYRVNSNSYPLKPDFTLVKSLQNAALQSNDGVYTWSLSSAVTPKKKLEKGIYILVASTFEPGYLATFQFNVYSSGSVQHEKYIHSS